MVTVEFTVTRREVQLGAVLFMARRRQTKLGFGFAILMSLFFLVVSAVYRDVFTFLTGFGVLVALLYLVWNAGRQAWKNTPMREGSTITLGDDGIGFTNAVVSSQVLWELYADAIETDSMFVLCTAQGYLPIPKRAFGSAADIDAARAVIRANARLSNKVLNSF